MKKIVLFGAGGFGREAASIIEEINKRENKYELLGFLDDNEEAYKGAVINGYPWLGTRNWILQNRDEVVCTCTIGDARGRAAVQKELSEQGVRFETLIAPGSTIAPFTEVGEGCIIYNLVSISVNCRIEEGVLLNRGVNIGHDSFIGAYASVMPGCGISGNCSIGSMANVGGHSYIIPGKKIGENATVAAGSIVFTNVKAGTTVLGNPAKRMKALE